MVSPTETRTRWSFDGRAGQRENKVENVEITVAKSGEVVITVPNPKTQLRKSQSGKTHIVASTGGFVPVPGTNVRVSLNVIS